MTDIKITVVRIVIVITATRKAKKARVYNIYNINTISIILYLLDLEGTYRTTIWPRTHQSGLAQNQDPQRGFYLFSIYQ